MIIININLNTTSMWLFIVITYVVKINIKIYWIYWPEILTPMWVDNTRNMCSLVHYEYFNNSKIATVSEFVFVVFFYFKCKFKFYIIKKEQNSVIYTYSRSYNVKRTLEKHKSVGCRCTYNYKLCEW